MSTYATVGGQINAEGGMKFLGQLFRSGYTRGLNVTQRGAGANMSVDVNVDSSSQGGGVFATSANVFYYAYQDATTNATVTTADPSNPRRDIVVAYIDLSLITSSSTNNLGALKFKAVVGTPAASPVDPSGATIQSSVGAGNPWFSLGRLAVGAAVSSIVNANITDLRVPSALSVPYVYGGSSNTNGHLVPNQADGVLVTTTDTNSVSAPMLATNAISLATVAKATSNQGSITSTTAIAVTSLGQSVTIPSGGRQIEIEAHLPNVGLSIVGNVYISIWDGTVGSGTQLQEDVFVAAGNTYAGAFTVKAFVSPSAGAKTYNVGVRVSTGTATINSSATSPSTLMTKAI